MPWAKLHTDILGDRKLMRAAREGAKGLHLLPWIIAFAKQADDGGRLTVGGEPANAIDIADQIPGVTPENVTECVTSLTKIKVLVPSGSRGVLRLAAWERRSGTKPSDGKDAVRERVTAHREREREKRNAESETPSNALHETPRNATEKRREEENRTETEVKPSAPDGAVSRAKVTWITPFAAAWQERYDGGMSVAPALRPMRKLITQYGEPEVLRRWLIYLDATDAQYATAARFAQTWGKWESRATANGTTRGGTGARSFANTLDAVRDL